MSAFRGGPADGVTLMFHRGPVYLRVVQGPDGFDVLDQLDDTPREDELVWVYRMLGDSRHAHLLYRGRGEVRSGWYEFSDYEHVEVDDETRERIRDTQEWRNWVKAQAPEVVE